MNPNTCNYTHTDLRDICLPSTLKESISEVGAYTKQTVLFKMTK